jgi:hypothetical protein
MENDTSKTKQISEITKETNLLNNDTHKKTVKTIDFHQINHLNFNDISNTIESACPTASSRKYLFNNYEAKNGKESCINELQIKKNLNRFFSQEHIIRPNVRIDNYGKEIKKGGKHKIAFADDVKIMQSLMGISPLEEKLGKNQNLSPSKSERERSNPIIEKIRRSNTMKNNRESIIKNIYNMMIKQNLVKKKTGMPLVSVINIESQKKETKLNTYLVKNNNKIAEDEQVCCSCYCSIF